MRNILVAGLLAGTVLTLSGCGKKDAASELDKGQVVATVDGKDVTIHELNAELEGVNVPSGDRRKLVEQQALQQIVGRRILADLARERGLDKTPMFVLQQRRGEDALLVNLLQRQLASTIKAPTRDDIQRFMSQNPGQFADRKIFTVDQIQFQPPQDLTKLKAYEPLKTLDEVEQQLIQDNLEYRRAPQQLDVVTANPQLVAQIVKLPEGEIFIIPNGRVMTANRITERKVVPFTGAEAENFAAQQIQGKKLADLAKTELDGKVKKARDAVKYQAGFAPPKAPGAPGALPAPAAK